jgi:predicted deacylase
VHGDEISPVRMIQTVMDQLNPVEMSGAVVAALDVSRPAMEGMARRGPNSGRGIDLIDLNREWPGNESGLTAPSRHAGILFNRLLKPNADYAIDFHTSTTGIDMAALHIARMDLPEVRAMAELFPIDQIFNNPLIPVFWRTRSSMRAFLHLHARPSELTLSSVRPALCNASGVTRLSASFLLEKEEAADPASPRRSSH